MNKEQEAVEAARQAWLAKALSDDAEERTWALDHPHDSAYWILMYAIKAEQAERAWEMYLEFGRRTNRFKEDGYGLPFEYLVRAAKLGAPWKNEHVLGRLLLPTKEYSVHNDGFHLLVKQAADPVSSLRELLAFVSDLRHPSLLGEIFVSTFECSEHWPWPELVEEIRSRALGSSLQLLKLLCFRLVSSYNDAVQDHRHGRRLQPPTQGGHVGTRLKAFKPILDHMSSKLGPEAFKVRFDLEFQGLPSEIRSKLELPYAHSWEEARKQKILHEKQLQIEALLAKSSASVQQTDLHTSRYLLRVVEEFIELPDKQRPIKLDALMRLRFDLNEIEIAHERETARREAEARAEEARRQVQEDLERAHEALHEEWQERIAARCRQIVTVFNGVFALDINPDSVLSGEVEGSYASIHSGGGGGGMRLELRQSMELRQEIHLLMQTGTWLELEEGGEEAEWAKAYEAENFLIWHELSHLADGRALRRILRLVPEYHALPMNERSQARELVIDALGLSLAEALYVHPDKKRHIVTPAKRQAVMLRALCVQIQRIMERDDDSLNMKDLLLRFFVQLDDAHRSSSELLAPTMSALTERLDLKSGIKSEQHLAYEAIYVRARLIDVLRLTFHSQVQSLEDESNASSQDESSESFSAAS